MNTSSSFSSNSSSFTKPSINEDQWIQNMRKSIIEHDDEEVNKIPVSIFSVPNVLLATNPECYIPQQVALGPFHHWRPEVYDMQRYKLAAARRTQKYMNTSFERIVEAMKKNEEARIRACYHKFIDMSGDALIWMMAVDMAFLLEFLVVYSMKEEDRTTNELVVSAMSHLVDVKGKKMTHMAILRDLVMVENQIPLFLLMTMLEHQHRKRNENKSAKETLKTMLIGLYRELSPFTEQELPDVDIDQCKHILDFFYHMTVPNYKEHRIEMHTHHERDIEHVRGDGEVQEKEKAFDHPSKLKRSINFVREMLSKTFAGIVWIIKKVIFGKPVAMMVKIPWKILSKLPIIKLLKGPIEEMLENFKGEGGDETKDDNGDQKTPTIEEITIPSVMEMANAGILFLPVEGGISEIKFDVKTSTLSLPVIKLDVNTEVYLRNLVAYEACVGAGPLVVARYTELMNGIIDTEEDAKYLRERNIISNELKSDKEVADLWNGMSKCVKLTKVKEMDKVIDDVNKRYGKTWRVKLSKFMSTYVFASWKLLTLLAALFMLFLTTVQAFCSVYRCARVFHQLPEMPGSEGASR